MPDRRERILRIICLVFAAILLCRLAFVVVRANPVRKLSIPALPSLPEEPAAAKNTNAPSAKVTGTNATNSASLKLAGQNATNAAAAQGSENKTNAPASSTPSNAPVSHVAEGASQQSSTNPSVALKPVERSETNPVPVLSAAKSTQGTNSLASTGTNRMGTNSTLLTGTNKPGTNAALAKGMPGRPDGANKPADVPPPIKARVERITASEVFGQVIRPMPMALLGIAGESAFLRGTNGQTGLVKEGAELGGLKLLRIGTNRVLVEAAGETKELTIFSGFGSESLLPKPKESTNEPPKKAP